MRLLNSVCDVIAKKYPGVPVYIEGVPEGFQRPSFLVSLATDSTNLKNLNCYEDNPTFQIVYFNSRNEALQVRAEGLYLKKEELKALFLFPGVMPVLPKEGVSEKQRYAHVNTFQADVRLLENAIYCRLILTFTDDARVEETYETIEDVEMVVSQN